MEALSTVTLHVFPRDDFQLAFRLDLIEQDMGGWDATGPEHLQAVLRAYYPGAVVRCQEPLGGLDPRHPTWYVYRDGSPHTD